MKNNQGKGGGGHCPKLLAGLGLAAFLSVSAPVHAQSVGAAYSFAILGGSGVSAAGAGSINGDVGVSPGTSITGFPAPASVVPPFSFAHSNDGAAINARAATLTLYNLLSGPLGATPVVGLNQTFGPGVYSLGATTLGPGQTLTLSGNGIYIFQLSSDLTTDVTSSVVLTNVNPCDVFWQVTSQATLNGPSFPGNVVAGSTIVLGTGANLTGRALAAAAGAVTMAGNNSVGGCSAAGGNNTGNGNGNPGGNGNGGGVSNVPTLQEWSLIFLGLMLATLGGWYYLPRKRS